MLHHNDSSAKRPTVVIVGGDIVDRASLCYEASNANLHIEPIAGLDELTPRDFAVADVFLVWDDPRLLEQLKARMGATESCAAIVMLQSQPTIQQVVAAMEAGVSDVLAWPCRPTALEDSVVAAMRKRQGKMPRWERMQRARQRLRALSEREREVMDGVACGLSNKEIAARLSISHRTVEIHRANALEKLAAAHTADAIRLVLEATLYGDEAADDLERWRGPYAA